MKNAGALYFQIPLMNWSSPYMNLCYISHVSDDGHKQDPFFDIEVIEKEISQLRRFTWRQSADCKGQLEWNGRICETRFKISENEWKWIVSHGCFRPRLTHDVIKEMVSLNHNEILECVVAVREKNANVTGTEHPIISNHSSTKSCFHAFKAVMINDSRLLLSWEISASVPVNKIILESANLYDTCGQCNIADTSVVGQLTDLSDVVISYNSNSKISLTTVTSEKQNAELPKKFGIIISIHPANLVTHVAIYFVAAEFVGGIYYH